MVVDCLGNITVVVAVVGYVPVAPIESDAVGHDLDLISRSGIRLAVGGGELVVARDDSRLQ
jgi:hypothetical protein